MDIDDNIEEDIYIKNCSDFVELHILLKDYFSDMGLFIYTNDNFNNFMSLINRYSTAYKVINNSSDIEDE